VPISELVFGTLTQNRSSLEDRATTRRCHRASGRAMRSKIFGVQFAAGGGTVVQLVRHNLFGSRFGSSRLVRMVYDPQCRATRQSRQIQEKAQDYSGFG
jgi:hypothetical protein